MAISYNTRANCSHIFRATNGGTVFSANLATTGNFDYFLDNAKVNDAIYFGSSGAYIAVSDIDLNVGTPITGTDYDDGASIITAEFDNNDIKFTRDDSQTVILANAKIELKGDEGRSALDIYREVAGDPDATELDMITALIGEQGEKGVGISSIGKTATNSLIDTYTITYTDGSTSMFNITNGNGISDIIKTNTTDLVDTYRINYTNGSYATFRVTNGDKGDTGSTIESAEFSGDDIIFTKDDSTTVALANAKTELKGDRGIDADILKITSQTKLSGYVQSSTMENSVVYNYLRDDDNIIIGVNKV